MHFSSRMFLAHSEAQSVRRTCGKMGEDRGGHISLINLLTEFYRRNFFMNAKGRVKEGGAFKFYEQESSRRGMSYHARRTTHTN